MKIRPKITPQDDVELDSKLLYLQNQNRMQSRAFRDALTRADKAVRGIKTNATQWNRWSP